MGYVVVAPFDYASRMGFEELQLDVRAHNGGARAFYEALGFTVAQTRLAKRF